jgi:hypothetical protein
MLTIAATYRSNLLITPPANRGGSRHLVSSFAAAYPFPEPVILFNGIRKLFERDQYNSVSKGTSFQIERMQININHTGMEDSRLNLFQTNSWPMRN